MDKKRLFYNLLRAKAVSLSANKPCASEAHLLGIARFGFPNGLLHDLIAQHIAGNMTH